MSSDLRFGLAALRLGYVSKPQLLDAAAAWLMGDAVSLVDVLVRRGFVEGTRLAAVEKAAHAAADPEVEADLREGLLRLNLPQDERRWLLELPGLVRAPEPFAPMPPEERYRLGEEIGRGGIGQVVIAEDRSLGREVAIKLVLDAAREDVAERFVREARVTARLEHPNIVPVHDFGAVPDESGKARLFLCMKRIRGKDLWQVIQEQLRGDGERVSRARLLRVFQEVCLAIGFAHSRGVVHRDLKPSNVMLGEFGEVLVVDWGLAKLVGEPEPAPRPGGRGATRRFHKPRKPAQDTPLTFEGDVVGTPAYMPPEQAEGRGAEVGARSDVYALGAILYHILTFQPPFEGLDTNKVIEEVRTGLLLPPSTVVADLWAARKLDPARPPAALPRGLPEAVPPELDAICLRAMEYRSEARYAGALEMHDAVQAFLEGREERERREALAVQALERGRAAMAALAELKEKVAAAERETQELEKKVRPLEPKDGFWAAEDRLRELRRAWVEAFSEADGALDLALEHHRGHAEARRLKAQLHWDRFLEAELAGDEDAMLLYKRVVERHDDGGFAERLRGDGTLTLRVRAWGCRCLRDGRRVAPAEVAGLGYQLQSGRALDGHRGGEGDAALEAHAALTLRAHGPGCAAGPLPGAEGWLFRYEDVGRRRMPVTPPGAPAGRPVPQALLDALFAPDSEYRPRGPGIYLGAAPVEARPIAMGSWLILVAREGFAPARCPVSVERGDAVTRDVTLYRPEECPADMLLIPGGPFPCQGHEDPDARSRPEEIRTLPDFWIGRHPVTCREYAEYLNDLAPAEAARRVPRAAEGAGAHWPGPPWRVPTREWLAEAPAEARARLRPFLRDSPEWDADWPVMGISWLDAMAYAAWRTRREQRLHTLPHEVEWEKAARGPDRRHFPWGNRGDNRWANTNRSFADGMRPAPVQAFPADESPYGVRGMGGNVYQVCLNDPGPEYAGWRLTRGANWITSSARTRLVDRLGGDHRSVGHDVGFRLVVPAMLPGAAGA